LEDEEEEENGPLTSIDPWAGLPYTIDLETGKTQFTFFLIFILS